MNQRKYDSMLKKIDKIGHLENDIRKLINEDPHIMPAAKSELNDTLSTINRACGALSSHV